MQFFTPHAEKIRNLVEVHENRIEELERQRRALPSGPYSQFMRDRLDAQIDAERDTIEGIKTVGEQEAERQRKLLAAQELERERLEAELDQRLRSSFFSAIPGATEADFVAARPRLIADLHAETKKRAEQEALRHVASLVPGGIPVFVD